MNNNRFQPLMDDDDDDDIPEIEPVEPNEEPEEEDEDKPDKKDGPSGSMDDRLLKNRTILIYGEIDMALAQDVTKRLLVMDSESQDEIRIFINSPGGHVESGDTIFDMIRFVKSPVKVVGTGWVASAALSFARHFARPARASSRFSNTTTSSA